VSARTYRKCVFFGIVLRGLNVKNHVSKAIMSTQSCARDHAGGRPLPYYCSECMLDEMLPLVLLPHTMVWLVTARTAPRKQCFFDSAIRKPFRQLVPACDPVAEPAKLCHLRCVVGALIIIAAVISRWYRRQSRRWRCL